MEKKSPGGFSRVLAPFTELFGLSRGIALVVFVLVTGLAALALFWFFYSAPPRTITITSGVAGSGFETNAYKYKEILASNGVTLRILQSLGSSENLQRLSDPKFKVDVGFVQSGITNPPGGRALRSLGSVSFQPLIIFYKSAKPLEVLSDFKGKRLAIGPVGSGTHSLGMTLLAMNGVDKGSGTTFVDLEAEAAAKALMAGEVDAVFLMGDSASPQLMRSLFQTEGVQIFSFAQADAYSRRLSYLNKLELPKGVIDFGKNIPPRDVLLVAPSVELVAREDMHPVLIDLLIEAAQDVHGTPGVFRKKGEFPSSVERDMPIHVEAQRYYKSGKTGLYRYLPFWLASVVNRVLMVVVPLLVVLIPGLRMLPSLLRLRVKLQIYRWYRGLLALDRELLRGEISAAKRKELLDRLDEISVGVHQMKVPASFADQFYGLRAHIGMVRERLERAGVGVGRV